MIGWNESIAPVVPLSLTTKQQVCLEAIWSFMKFNAKNIFSTDRRSNPLAFNVEIPSLDRVERFLIPSKHVCSVFFASRGFTNNVRVGWQIYMMFPIKPYVNEVNIFEKNITTTVLKLNYNC